MKVMGMVAVVAMLAAGCGGGGGESAECRQLRERYDRAVDRADAASEDESISQGGLDAAVRAARRADEILFEAGCS